MLEDVRKRLRSLVKFVEKTKRPTIYTDFVDSMGEEQEIALRGFDAGHNVERFLDKTQQFLKAHNNDPVIHKTSIQRMDARSSTLRFTFH